MHRVTEPRHAHSDSSAGKRMGGATAVLTGAREPWEGDLDPGGAALDPVAERKGGYAASEWVGVLLPHRHQISDRNDTDGFSIRCSPFKVEERFA